MPRLRKKEVKNNSNFTQGGGGCRRLRGWRVFDGFEDCAGRLFEEFESYAGK